MCHHMIDVIEVSWVQLWNESSQTKPNELMIWIVHMTWAPRHWMQTKDQPRGHCLYCTYIFFSVMKNKPIYSGISHKECWALIVFPDQDIQAHVWHSMTCRADSLQNHRYADVASFSHHTQALAEYTDLSRTALHVLRFFFLKWNNNHIYMRSYGSL